MFDPEKSLLKKANGAGAAAYKVNSHI